MLIFKPVAQRTLTSADILERFRRDHAKDINLTLRPAYRALLEKLGNPHLKLPPVFHVAGTNGKGSTCAFLRAILEAAGYKVHVYTSPHLVTFHERIRVAGKWIGEDELVSILSECENLSAPGSISYFEAATAAAFTAFTRHPADFTILEVGLGGRLDATNVIEKPLATLVTRVSFDHREYLGNTLATIAREKAGIMKKGVPCFVAPQPDPDVRDILESTAHDVGCSLKMGGRDWQVEDHPSNLVGAHQHINASLAISALSILPQSLSEDTITHGLQSAEWPARLQKLTTGKLCTLLPAHWELWLDGGHNDSAGEVLAAQCATWKKADNRPLHLILGMLTTKEPGEFLAPLLPFAASLTVIPIPDEPLSLSSRDLAARVCKAGFEDVKTADSINEAISTISKSDTKPARIFICGSLYLAGSILRLNQPNL